MRPFQSPPESVSSSLQVLPDLALAKREMCTAWEQYKQSTIKRFKDGLDFGRACHEWQAKYKAQGSRNGKGFEHLLEELAIPKTTAYRWIGRYEMKNGLRSMWNEVRDNPVALRTQSPSNSHRIERQTTFNFLLTERQRQKFNEDVKTLGGHKKVAEMFVGFVSQKASEKRAVNTARKQVGRDEEGIRRMVVGA
jgi:hypothetical protein